MGRENATTMMQPSSDQANTKARGCELPGDKTILPRLPHGDSGEARSTHMAPTWSGWVQKSKIGTLDIVKYRTLAGPLNNK